MGNASSISETDEELVPIERKRSPRTHSKRSPRQRNFENEEYFEEEYHSFQKPRSVSPVVLARDVTPREAMVESRNDTGARGRNYHRSFHKQRDMSPVVMSRNSMPREAILDRRNDTGASGLTDDLTHGFTTDEDSCSYGPRPVPQRAPSPLFDEDELTALTDMAHDGDDEATNRGRRLVLNQTNHNNFTATNLPIEVPVSFVDDAAIENIHSPLSATIVKSPQNCSGAKRGKSFNHNSEQREQSFGEESNRGAETNTSVSVSRPNVDDMPEESKHDIPSPAISKRTRDINEVRDHDSTRFIEQRETNIGPSAAHSDGTNQSIEVSVSIERDETANKTIVSPTSVKRIENPQDFIDEILLQDVKSDLIDQDQVEVKMKSEASNRNVNDSLRESRVEAIRRSYEENEAEFMRGQEKETLNPVGGTKDSKNKANESKCSTVSSLHIIVPGVDVGEKIHYRETKKKNRRSVPVVIAFSPKDGSVGDNSSTTMDIPVVPASSPLPETMHLAPAVVATKDVGSDQRNNPTYLGKTDKGRRPDPPSVSDPRPDDQSIERNTKRKSSATFVNGTDNLQEKKQASSVRSMMTKSKEEVSSCTHLASKAHESIKLCDSHSKTSLSGSTSDSQNSSRKLNKEEYVHQNIKTTGDAIIHFPKGTTNCSNNQDATEPQEFANSSMNNNNLKTGTQAKPTENDDSIPTIPAPSSSQNEVGPPSSSQRDLKYSNYSLQDFDLDMVEKYEDLFNAFLEKNPDLKAKNPFLVDILRVAKLQKQLVVTEYIENELDEIVKSLMVRKKAMAAIYHEKLKEASKRKAAREIQLQQEFDQANHETLVMKAKMKWEIVEMCESRSKRNAKIQQNLSSVKATTNHILSILPENLGEFGETIQQAVNAPSSRFLTQEQYLELQKLQMDNAFLNAKASVLEKKLAYLQTRARNHEWVDSVLKILDKKKHQQLKRSFQKKMGVSF